MSDEGLDYTCTQVLVPETGQASVKSVSVSASLSTDHGDARCPRADE